MDRMRACGVCDVGSIPTEGTRPKASKFIYLRVGIEKLLPIF